MATDVQTSSSEQQKFPAMETSLLNRVQATLLALATAALFVLAVFNFLQERQYSQPDDGVWWSEANGGLQAVKVQPDSPGQRAGIQTGDLLTGVSDSASSPVRTVTHVSDLERALGNTGSYIQVFYSVTRDGTPLDTPVKVIPVPADRSLQLGLRVIGLIYLIIGFYVLFRRWGAPRATHFYLFCLVSFALYALQVHQRPRRSRLDRFLDERRRRSSAAGSVPAFRAQLP